VNSLISVLVRGLRHPKATLGFLLAYARGSWYRLSLAMLRRRFYAGRGFLVYGRLSVRGPGTVIFGDNVAIYGRVTPWTYADDAVIRVGNHSSLEGTRFGCKSSIAVGSDCILAEARIADWDFHSVHANRHDPAAPIRVAPVQIEDNVWIGADTGIMPGTVIGRDSVVSFGAVCAGRYPQGVVLAGNPARVAAKIPAASSEPPATEATLSRVQRSLPPRGSSVEIETVIARALGIPVESVDESLEFRAISEWDSMGHLRLVVALGEALGVAIDDELAVELTSVPAIRAFASKVGAG
jgi:acetyltransferase-like isoleucine patch superfamily enzyme/acyl carrier protein